MSASPINSSKDAATRLQKFLIAIRSMPLPANMFVTITALLLADPRVIGLFSMLPLRIRSCLVSLFHRTPAVRFLCTPEMKDKSSTSSSSTAACPAVAPILFGPSD